MMRIEAILPLPEEINGYKVTQNFYQNLVNESHDVVEKIVKKIGRGHKDFYEVVGSCRCAARGKMIYISGEVSHIPENTKYLSLAITTTSNIFFVFTEASNVVDQPNFTVREV